MSGLIGIPFFFGRVVPRSGSAVDSANLGDARLEKLTLGHNEYGEAAKGPLPRLFEGVRSSPPTLPTVYSGSRAS